jgi:predicted dehydrogenase
VPWFLRKAEAGGGVVMDWGIYTAFMINWFMGPVASVYATCETFRKEVRVGDELLTDIDVEDTMAATLRFASGAMGTWSSTWAGPARHGYTSIDGTRGSLLMRDGAGEGINLYSTCFDEPDHLRGWRRLQISELQSHW